MTFHRLLVIEDFEPFRRLISSILTQCPELQIVGEASNGWAGFQKIRELQPDLVVLDIGLPGLNGIDVARKALKIAPKTRILFLSHETSMDIALETVRAGALGYVQKTRANKELLTAVDSVLRGVQFIGSGLTTSEAGELSGGGTKHFRNCI